MTTIDVQEIAKINLAPDEVLFVKLKDESPVKHQIAESILSKIFGQGKVVVTGPHTEVFGVKRPPQKENAGASGGGNPNDKQPAKPVEGKAS